jgi:acetolactate synthase-1/2/3 large subunit
MHLNDSFGKQPGLEVIYNHHEQASAMAAEAYARLTGRLALVCVTSGPGGINALNGVFGAWTDSIPMLVVSGQVRYDTTVRSAGLPLRQLGDQEYDIARTAAAMTKYAVMITDPAEVRYHLERALYLARAGRPGPCWLDVPHNVQAAMIDPAAQKAYSPEEDPGEIPPPLEAEVARQIVERIRRAERPVVLVGSAVRSSGSLACFAKLIEALNIPVVTAFNAHDAIAGDHRLYCGRPGSVGDRGGNFAVQNADLLLVLGCRLNVRQIGYNFASFARAAYKIVVDIDAAELQKPTVRPDLPLHADVADCIAKLWAVADENPLPRDSVWLRWCRERCARYPVVLPEYWELRERVNPYCFVDRLGRHLAEDAIVVAGDGTACIAPFQALPLGPAQRLFSNSGSASMGYDLPAAIGACMGADGRSVACLAGDGSIQMNLQELQTIVHNRLPIKIFVLNNDGYHSIRQTQSSFFGTPLVGCDPQSGVSFPDMGKIAAAYGIPFVRCGGHDALDACIGETLCGAGPAICEVVLTPDQPFAPKTVSRRLPSGAMVSRPLEDLFPLLPREEFRGNMLIEPLAESAE